ncbi:MAG: ABC transporter permease [Candidatus Tectomicrobia bacterium]|nr:ABC transporter permease [Candidatus Tectomicrobia bacterium]
MIREVAIPKELRPAEISQENAKTQSRLKIIFKQLKKNKGAMVGAVLLLLFILVSIFADSIAPYDPIKMNPAEAMMPPNLNHWFGTDNFGRDILSRVIHGARISLWVGVISVAIGAFFGVVLGLISGYYGRWIDATIMRVTDGMLAFPGLLLALVIVAVLGPSLFNLMIAVGISSIPRYTRLVRGSVISAKANLYIEAAHTVGCQNFRIMFVHLLPNVFAPVIVVSTLGVAGAILIAAGLSFLGIGVRPPTPEWGAMLSGGRDYLRIAWWITVFPGLAITVTVLGINMLGDGLRDALDPRLKT